MTKRIFRVYQCKPHYFNPKEVTRIFKLVKQHRDLQLKLRGLQEALFKKVEIAQTEVDIEKTFEEIKLVANVITPSRCKWVVERLTDSEGNEFEQLTITEEIHDELHSLTEGQDDGK